MNNSLLQTVCFVPEKKNGLASSKNSTCLKQTPWPFNTDGFYVPFSVHVNGFDCFAVPNQQLHTVPACLQRSWRLKECFCTCLASNWQGQWLQVRPLTWGYAMLMSPNEDETAVYDSPTGVIWLCACVRYWPYCRVGTCASVLKFVFFDCTSHFKFNNY